MAKFRLTEEKARELGMPDLYVEQQKYLAHRDNVQKDLHPFNEKNEWLGKVAELSELQRSQSKNTDYVSEQLPNKIKELEIKVNRRETHQRLAAALSAFVEEDVSELNTKEEMKEEIVPTHLEKSDEKVPLVKSNVIKKSKTQFDELIALIKEKLNVSRATHKRIDDYLGNFKAHWNEHAYFVAYPDDELIYYYNNLSKLSELKKKLSVLLSELNAWTIRQRFFGSKQWNQINKQERDLYRGEVQKFSNQLRGDIKTELQEINQRKKEIVESMLARLECASFNRNLHASDLLFTLYDIAHGVKALDSSPKEEEMFAPMPEYAFIFYHDAIFKYGSYVQIARLKKCFWFEKNDNDLIPVRALKNGKYPVPVGLEKLANSKINRDTFYGITQINVKFNEVSNFAKDLLLNLQKFNDVIDKLDKLSLDVDKLARRVAQQEAKSFFGKIFHWMRNRSVRKLNEKLRQAQVKLVEKYINVVEKATQDFVVVHAQNGLSEQQKLDLMNKLKFIELKLNLFHLSTTKNLLQKINDIYQKSLISGVAYNNMLNELKLNPQEMRFAKIVLDFYTAIQTLRIIYDQQLSIFYTDEGIAKFNEGNFNEASVKFKEALDLDSKNLKAIQYQSLMEKQKAYETEVERAIKKEVNIETVNVFDIADASKELSINIDKSQIVRLLEKRAAYLVEFSANNQAIACYKQLQELSPDNVEYPRELRKLLLLNDKQDSAKMNLADQILKLDPSPENQAVLLIEQRDLAIAQKNYETAIDSYDKLIQLQPHLRNEQAKISYLRENVQKLLAESLNMIRCQELEITQGKPVNKLSAEEELAISGLNLLAVELQKYTNVEQVKISDKQIKTNPYHQYHDNIVYAEAVSYLALGMSKKALGKNNEATEAFKKAQEKISSLQTKIYEKQTRQVLASMKQQDRKSPSPAKVNQIQIMIRPEYALLEARAQIELEKYNEAKKCIRTARTNIDMMQAEETVKNQLRTEVGYLEKMIAVRSGEKSATEIEALTATDVVITTKTPSPKAKRKVDFVDHQQKQQRAPIATSTSVTSTTPAAISKNSLNPFEEPSLVLSSDNGKQNSTNSKVQYEGIFRNSIASKSMPNLKAEKEEKAEKMLFPPKKQDSQRNFADTLLKGLITTDKKEKKEEKQSLLSDNPFEFEDAGTPNANPFDDIANTSSSSSPFKTPNLNPFEGQD